MQSLLMVHVLCPLLGWLHSLCHARPGDKGLNRRRTPKISLDTMAGLSIRDVLNGNCLFVTGGLGFLGSVCLEQLLRLTEVSPSSLRLCARPGGYCYNKLSCCSSNAGTYRARRDCDLVATLVTL